MASIILQATDEILDQPYCYHHSAMTKPVLREERRQSESLYGEGQQILELKRLKTISGRASPFRLFPKARTEYQEYIPRYVGEFKTLHRAFLTYQCP